MFRITDNNGFQITFKNGYTISCKFGTCNYCDRRLDTAPYGSELGMGCVESDNCEVFIWKCDEEFITGEICNSIGVSTIDRVDGVDVYGDGLVLGYAKPEVVAKLIFYISIL